MRKFFLIEDYSEQQDYAEGEIVALTPEACFSCWTRHKTYRIIEDFYEEDRLTQFEIPYLKEQLEWFSKLDDLVQQHVPFCKNGDLRIVSLLRYHLKYFLDSLVSNAYFFNGFFERARPDSICYVKSVDPSIPQEPKIDADLFNDNGRRFLKPLVALMAKTHGIPYCELTEEALAGSAQVSTAVVAPNVSFKTLAKNVLKPLFFFFKYGMGINFLRWQKPFRHIKVVFTCAGHKDLDPVMRGLLQGGASLYLKEGDLLKKIGAFSHETVCDLNSVNQGFLEEITLQFESVAKRLLEGSEFSNWVNRCCGIDVRSILLPYLQSFFTKTCVRVLAQSVPARSLFDAQNIKLLVARAATILPESGLLLAASQGASPKRICFQHACHATDFPMWKLSQLAYFDAFFATDPVSRRYTELLNAESTLGETHCAIYEYGHFLGPRRVPRNSSSSRETIYYVPTRNPVGIRILNVPYYPATWYFHLQKSMIDLLSTFEDKSIIFKYVRANDWLTHSTLAYISRMNYSNIRVDDTPFYKLLTDIDRVILDYPGTAFYESVAAGLPTLCFYHKRFHLHEPAKACFEPLLKSFENFEEVKKEVETFLQKPSTQYQIPFELYQGNVCEELAAIAGMHSGPARFGLSNQNESSNHG